VLLGQRDCHNCVRGIQSSMLPSFFYGLACFLLELSLHLFGLACWASLFCVAGVSSSSVAVLFFFVESSHWNPSHGLLEGCFHFEVTERHCLYCRAGYRLNLSQALAIFLTPTCGVSLIILLCSRALVLCMSDAECYVS